MNYIMQLYDMHSQQGQTILLGDFNSDLRYSASHRPRSRCLQRALEERNLYSVIPLDDETKYTFNNKGKDIRTMIDYVFVNIEYLSRIVGYTIDTGISYNISDHLPILVCMRSDPQMLHLVVQS